MSSASCNFTCIAHTFFAVFFEISCFFPELRITYSGADCQRRRNHIPRSYDILIIITITYCQIFCSLCRNLKFHAFQNNTFTFVKNFHRKNGRLLFSFKDIRICPRLLMKSDKLIIQTACLSLTSVDQALQPHERTINPAFNIPFCIINMTDLCPCIFSSGKSAVCMRRSNRSSQRQNTDSQSRKCIVSDVIHIQT